MAIFWLKMYNSCCTFILRNNFLWQIAMYGKCYACFDMIQGCLPSAFQYCIGMLEAERTFKFQYIRLGTSFNVYIGTDLCEEVQLATG